MDIKEIENISNSLPDNPSDDFDELMFDYAAYNPYQGYDDEDDDIEPENDITKDIYIPVKKDTPKEMESIDNMSDEEINSNAELYGFEKEKPYVSKLLEYFPFECCIELEKISKTYSIDNNRKMKEIKNILNKYNIQYAPLGGGTNRYAIMIDGYAIKIAYDKDGKIDNKREYIYSLALQPYVVKTYEVSETGLFSVCEYVEIFSIDDYYQQRDNMRKILKDIAGYFLIGDVGLTSKNYGNWGFRDNGELVILDYAYIYSVSYKHFECNCKAHSILYYDRDFVNLVCPTCGKKYPFSAIRRKITRKDQDNEIGDVLKKGFVLTKEEENKEFNYNFILGADDTIRKIIMKNNKEYHKKLNKISQIDENKMDEHPKSFEEILENIENVEVRNV